MANALLRQQHALLLGKKVGPWRIFSMKRGGLEPTISKASFGRGHNIIIIGCELPHCTFRIQYTHVHVPPFFSSSLFLVVDGYCSFAPLSFAQGETDVLGCNVDASSMVNVVDTWNPLPNQAANEPDVTNSSLCVYETMFTGDRISCQ